MENIHTTFDKIKDRHAREIFSSRPISQGKPATRNFTPWSKIEDFNAKHYSTGRIGFHLAKRLLIRGDTVVGIDNIYPVK